MLGICVFNKFIEQMAKKQIKMGEFHLTVEEIKLKLQGFFFPEEIKNISLLIFS